MKLGHNTWLYKRLGSHENSLRTTLDLRFWGRFIENSQVTEYVVPLISYITDYFRPQDFVTKQCFAYSEQVSSRPRGGIAGPDQSLKQAETRIPSSAPHGLDEHG